MMTTIRVQRKHLHFPVEIDNCPVFRAIDEVATGLKRVFFSSAMFDGGSEYDFITIPLPSIARIKQLEFFDIPVHLYMTLDHIEEFEFDLDIPDHLLRESPNLQLQEV